jgi:hypothetical protein
VGKLQNNQNGFSAVEALLLIVIVAIIGGTGWYVWHAKSNTNKALTVNNSSTPSFKKKAAPAATPAQVTDPTAGWTSYASKDGGFSLKHPNTWVTESNATACGNNSVTLGPSVATAGKCDGSAFEVGVGYTNHGCFPFDDTFTSVTTADVTISGKTGKKYTGTSTSQSNYDGLPAGSKVVLYCLGASTSGYNYEVSYNQTPSFPDVFSDFDLLVNKTLQLSN